MDFPTVHRPSAPMIGSDRSFLAGMPTPPDKLSCLSAAARAGGAPPEIVETHMSWVVLGDSQVLKLKKPVRYDFLDFSTVEAREFNCREEVRLNRRLAPQVYLGVAPLCVDGTGRLAVGALDPMPDGSATVAAPQGAVDWLVCMRRLPAARMLDRAIAERTVTPVDIDRLADRLALFYRSVPAADLDGDAYLGRHLEAQRLNRVVLLDARFAQLECAATLQRFDRALGRHGALLSGRADCVVDGHGDLRPEHVALNAVPVVIDCLEFNRGLRAADPLDELAFLGLECRLLGAGWIDTQLVARYSSDIGAAPPALLELYRAQRALLRARLCAAHLLEPEPRTPARWLPLARRYLELGERALDALEAG